MRWQLQRIIKTIWFGVNKNDIIFPDNCNFEMSAKDCNYRLNVSPLAQKLNSVLWSRWHGPIYGDSIFWPVLFLFLNGLPPYIRKFGGIWHGLHFIYWTQGFSSVKFIVTKFDGTNGKNYLLIRRHFKIPTGTVLSSVLL